MIESSIEKLISAEVLINNISEGFCIYRVLKEHPYLKYIVWNKRMVDITGYTMEEMNLKGWYNILNENSKYDDSNVSNTIAKFTKDKIEKEYEMIRKDGSSIIISATISVIDLIEDEKTVLVLVRDITENKKAEAALRRSEKKYRELFNNVNDSIFLHKIKDIGKPGEFEEVNDVACNRLGYSREEMSRMNLFDFNVGLTMESIEETKKQLYTKGQAMHLSYNKTKDGELYPVEVNSILITLNEEEYALSISRDISEREESEQALKEAVEYEVLRTEFFANISHELRTPINLISSTLQLFNLYLCGMEQSSEISAYNVERFEKHITIMKQNCNRLIRLINNLIDVTRIDAGFFELNLSNNNIISVVEDITLSIAEYIENKGISLVFDTEVEEKLLACDSDKIERVILNIISNAVKFTPAGGSIFVNLFDKGDKIIISIKDTGIGISGDKQRFIFERFVQVDKSLTRSREGSGIGLSLVKSLVEMHKGTIKVQSEPDKGSEFIIELPVYLMDETEEAGDAQLHTMEGNVQKVNIEFSDIY